MPSAQPSVQSPASAVLQRETENSDQQVFRCPRSCENRQATAEAEVGLRLECFGWQGQACVQARASRRRRGGPVDGVGGAAGRPSRSGSQALQAGFPRRSLPEPFSPPAVAGRDTLLRPCRAVASPARPWHRTVLAKPFDPAESQLPPRSRGLGWGSRPRCPSRAQPGASPGCTRWPFVVALL